METKIAKMIILSEGAFVGSKAFTSVTLYP